MKKLTALLLTLALLVYGLAAFAEGGYENDPVALNVNGYEVTESELKTAARLYIFEGALQCAGYGYGLDIVDPLTIEDEMDKLVFDMERWYLSQDLAEGMGLYPLSDEATAEAVAEAEAAWQRYWDIACSDNGMAFLPAGDYQQVDGDDEGNLTRYFASFGLTRETLLDKAVLEQTCEELQKAISAGAPEMDDDALITWYADWFIAELQAADITENSDVIARASAELWNDPSENQGGNQGGNGDIEEGGYEAYERSIVIEGTYYTLGESTIRDFEQSGWTWTQDESGRFVFQVTEEGNYFYVRTDNGQPDGKVVMIDMFYVYDISYEYLGCGMDKAYDPERDIYEVLFESYGEGESDDEGIIHVQTPVFGGTLLIELGEGAIRLTLEP